ISMKNLYSFIQAGLLGAVLLLATPQAQAAITLVQTVKTNSASGASATAILSSTHAGNLLVVAIWYDYYNNPTPPSTTITDSAGDSFINTGEYGAEAT